MMCLGRHWNPLTYRYAATREDFDGAAVPPVPEDWATLASALAADAGFAFTPDICLINYDGDNGRMGLHQDKDESPTSLAAGAPVVSISLGDTARFLFGGPRRREPGETLLLESGDVFVFGGAARLRYHGVAHPPSNRAASVGLRRTVQPDVPTGLAQSRLDASPRIGSCSLDFG